MIFYCSTDPHIVAGFNSEMEFKIFVGWKESNTHNGPGIRVSVTESADGGTTWASPYSMTMFTSGTTGQSDPWLVWHYGIAYYTYLEYSIAGPLLSQITVARSDDYDAS